MGSNSPNKQRRQKTISLNIFDWDDTLFPTSAFTPRTNDEMKQIRTNNAKFFAELDTAVSQLLLMSLENGSTTVIVTNAHKTWVDYSAEMTMPKTYQLLDDQVKVISARQEGENRQNPTQWKSVTFLEVFEIFKMDKEMVTNLVVVGDSMNEMNAGQRLAKQLPHCILKMIKMTERPQAREIVKQLGVISASWQKISQTARNFNMQLERKSHEKN